VAPTEARPHAWQRYGPVGGDPFLAFLNTVDDPGKTRYQNALPDVTTTIAFARTVELLSDDDLDPPLAETHEDLLRLKEVGWSVLSAHARSETPPDGLMTELHVTMSRALKRSTLTAREGEALCWQPRSGPTLLLDRLAMACIHLITSGHADQITECTRCTALFLTEERAPRRRFCRPQTCGNRAKVERHRSRSRGDASR
jgi:predicted RNA-binding Zn ribbon-like protein